MSSFSDLIKTLDQPDNAVQLRHLGATADVLKYAPPRLRADAGDQVVARAVADAAYWRERAFKAETKLRALETRVQQLAKRAQGR
ncbi:MAG: hypothetical protein JSR72_13030 [Proteobacteria bacterium]|nr:hypothetical protein [Pseudomonadota bacterium]